ncbi:unnamed protein product [Musa banksii]
MDHLPEHEGEAEAPASKFGQASSYRRSRSERRSPSDHRIGPSRSNMASSPSARRRRLQYLSPTETLEIGGGGLSLSPRVKLLLTFFRSDPAVKPIDEWKLKLALLDFLRSHPLSLSVPDDDLVIRRRPDLHKRKRDEPVASGTLFVRDLGFLKSENREGDEEDEGASRKRFFDWRSTFVDRLAGIDLNLEGVKFKMTVEIPPADDFELMKKSWEDYYTSQLLDSRRAFARRPDTVIVRGVPSRWFAEPRVSSKASMLVTHTIFSTLGKIRNLNVASDDDLGVKSEESKEEIISGLNCKVWVQFESYDDFYNAMKVLYGRSMQKEGSRLKVDYEVSWDRDGYFRNVNQKPYRSYRQERDSSTQVLAGNIRNEPSKNQPHMTFDSNGSRRKRFRTVYLVEKLTADNRVYHKACFRCHHCKGTLKLGNYNSFEGVLYCRPHFDQIYKSTGSLDKSFEGTPKVVKPEKFVDNENANKVSSAFAGTREKCVGCKKTVYPIERVTVNGTAYHKSCFKCSHGGCTISPSNYIAHEGTLYCKHHHIQLIKQKGNYSKLEDEKEKTSDEAASPPQEEESDA